MSPCPGETQAALAKTSHTVTDISEDAQDSDLRELFDTLGYVARLYVGRDQEAGIGKGFAFGFFDERTIYCAAGDGKTKRQR